MKPGLRSDDPERTATGAVLPRAHHSSKSQLKLILLFCFEPFKVGIGRRGMATEKNTEETG